MIPTLETQRLKLVAPDQSSFDSYCKFYTDPEASRLYGGPITEQQTWARLKADLGSWYLLGFGVWVVQQKSDNQFVGTCGFWQGKDWPVELTWWMLPHVRGKGYATEASEIALKHAYGGFNWPKVETYMDDDNLAALALAKKLNGKFDRRADFPDGKSRDIYILPKP